MIRLLFAGELEARMGHRKYAERKALSRRAARQTFAYGFESRKKIHEQVGGAHLALSLEGELLPAVTGHFVLNSCGLENWFFHAAAINRSRTTGLELAPWWWVRR